MSPTNVDTSSGATTSLTITGTGFTAGSNARLVDNSGKIVEFTTVTRNSSTQITAVVTHSDLDTAQSPYDIQVTNGEGISILSANQLDVNASPIWITTAGSLGSDVEGSSVTYNIQAYDPDSTSVVSYELQSGSLPPGLSLSSGSGDIGTISGTTSAVAATTTSNFVIRATDSASNTSSRSFSITVTNVPVSQSFTSSGTFSVPAGTTIVDVLVVAGGGGSGANHAGGGGAGGLVFFPEYPVTACGTVTVTVGCGGTAGARGQGTCALYGGSGGDSIFGSPGDPGLGQGGVITAKGGGGGGGGPEGPRQGSPGGSGGGGNGHGASYQSYSGAGSATQPTQPGNSGAYGFGNGGGQGIHTGQTPQNHLSAGGGGGAGAAGQSGNYNGPTAGGGGAGRAYTIADGTTPVYYAGGGAGTNNGVGPGAFTRPLGGGGQCGPAGGPTGENDGLANRGGGGGGDGNPAGLGGKGVVIVRY